jgi:hypothetical protein
MNWRKILLVLAGLEICGVGLVYLIAPQVMAASNGMELRGVNDWHATRAAYGGVFVAFGALFGMGAFAAALRRPALVAVATFMGGFALGRIASIVVDGLPAPAFLGALASEIVFGAGALVALSKGEA